MITFLIFNSIRIKKDVELDVYLERGSGRTYAQINNSTPVSRLCGAHDQTIQVMNRFFLVH